MDTERQGFFQSLGFRLLAPLFVTVGVVLAIHATFSFRSAKDDFLRIVRADVGRSSRLINRATHDGMLLNRREEVQATIKRLAEAPEIAAIRIYNKQGSIAMSADEEEIGRPMPLGSETCQSCHPEGKRTGPTVSEQAGPARVSAEVDVLRHLSVIENEPSCATAACHAHPATQRVLGVIDLEMSMAPLQTVVGTVKRQFLYTTLSLMVILGVVVAVFFRYVVQRPVFQLYEGTRRIADGDLDTRIEVRGRHELARLADAFNRMAKDLNAARQEVTQWSLKLEEKVVAKTEELRSAQRQVLHMEKMASLGKLSATVAHEINNPLSGMLTYARLVRRELRQQPIDPSIRGELTRYLSLMESECSRCGAIVRNMLLFSRQAKAVMAPVDVNEVVERSLVLVRHHLEIKGIRLDSRLLHGNREIVADAGQLQQALVALLVNAIEAMSGVKDGQRSLTVCVEGTDDEVRIDLSDTGVGIPPEVLPRIFEPFFSTKEMEKGVGLGLAVVYGIVERHGGRIDVESQVGRGTIFHLRLPRRAQIRDDEASTVADRAGPAP